MFVLGLRTFKHQSTPKATFDVLQINHFKQGFYGLPATEMTQNISLYQTLERT